MSLLVLGHHRYHPSQFNESSSIEPTSPSFLPLALVDLIVGVHLALCDSLGAILYPPYLRCLIVFFLFDFELPGA